MDTSPRKAVNTGPWWLLAVTSAICLVILLLLQAGGLLPRLASLALTLWFAAGAYFGYFEKPAPPKPIFAAMLIVVVGLAAYLLFADQFLAVIPGVVALIGLVANLRSTKSR